MASMATAMPAMMSLRICVLSFVGLADVIGGTPTKTPWRSGRYARSRECGELRVRLRATTHAGVSARTQLTPAQDEVRQSGSGQARTPGYAGECGSRRHLWPARFCWLSRWRARSRGAAAAAARAGWCSSADSVRTMTLPVGVAAPRRASSPGAFAELAGAAERLGYAHLWVSDHVRASGRACAQRLGLDHESDPRRGAQHVIEIAAARPVHGVRHAPALARERLERSPDLRL